jgi:predicted component of type VI protein secretion system
MKSNRILFFKVPVQNSSYKSLWIEITSDNNKKYGTKESYISLALNK